MSDLTIRAMLTSVRMELHNLGLFRFLVLSRYLHVIGDRAKPNSNRFPDGTEAAQRASLRVSKARRKRR
jgi:hypothetical protein